MKLEDIEVGEMTFVFLSVLLHYSYILMSIWSIYVELYVWIENMYK
jgi:hypothetical protein